MEWNTNLIRRRKLIKLNHKDLIFDVQFKPYGNTNDRFIYLASTKTKIVCKDLLTYFNIEFHSDYLSAYVLSKTKKIIIFDDEDEEEPEEKIETIVDRLNIFTRIKQDVFDYIENIQKTEKLILSNKSYDVELILPEKYECNVNYFINVVRDVVYSPPYKGKHPYERYY
jgi:hypothetical protein